MDVCIVVDSGCVVCRGIGRNDGELVLAFFYGRLIVGRGRGFCFSSFCKGRFICFSVFFVSLFGVRGRGRENGVFVVGCWGRGWLVI